MDQIDIIQARLHIQAVIADLRIRRNVIAIKQPQRTDLIDELDQMGGYLVQAFTVFDALEVEHRSLWREWYRLSSEFDEVRLRNKELEQQNKDLINGL